jgi:hypothetical protein
LLGRSLRSLHRHAVLYIAVALLSVGAQAAIVYAWNASAAIYVATALVPPFFVTIVNAFTFADLRGDRSSTAAWLRVLERSWAVLLIDLCLSLVASVGLGSIVSPDLLGKLAGVGMILIAASLVFADVQATLADDGDWWMILPRAFRASMLIAWQSATFSRAMLLFAASNLAPFLVALPIQSALAAHHVPHAEFWSDAASIVLLLPPVQAFATCIYLDAIGDESMRPCGG